jgi:hypothetical protein
MDLAPKKTDDNSEWVIIIGAAGAVGSFAVQVYISLPLKMDTELMDCTDCPSVRL